MVFGNWQAGQAAVHSYIDMEFESLHVELTMF